MLLPINPKGIEVLNEAKGNRLSQYTSHEEPTSASGMPLLRRHRTRNCEERMPNAHYERPHT